MLDLIIFVGIAVLGVIVLRWLLAKMKLEEPIPSMIWVVVVIAVLYFAVRFLLSLTGHTPLL